MALTFTEATYGGKTISVYEIDNDQFILEDFLDSRDQKIIEDAADGDGVDSTDMPNGQGTVLEYYSAIARSEEELTEQYNRYQITTGLASTITDIRDDVEDHETRISDLESA